MEECVAEVQRNDAACPDANGVTWGMIRWAVTGRGERYMAGYSKKCLCDICWNPIPQSWIQRPFDPNNYFDATRYNDGETSNGAEGWITAGPGTLDPSKYSEKRKAAIIQKQEWCTSNGAQGLEGWDPLFGMQTTTTTTTQAAVDIEDDVVDPNVLPEDSAEAVGDPHLTTIHGEKFDLDRRHLSH